MTEENRRRLAILNTLRVLMVEDDPDMMAFLRAYLIKSGIPEPIKAEDGQSALDVIDDDRLDIVMLDIGLPDMPGMDVLHHIKSTAADIFVVLVTADDSIESLQSAISAGANGYIVKPYSQEKVHDAINNYLMSRPGVNDLRLL